MTGGEGAGFERLVNERRRIVQRYEEMVEAAERLARLLAAELGVETLQQYGWLVGRVSASRDIGSDLVPVDLAPEAWIGLAHSHPEVFSPGYFYAIVDLKTASVVLGEVAESTRSSIPGVLGAQEPLTSIPLARPSPITVAGNVVSIRVYVRPVLAVHLGREGLEEASRARSVEELAGILAEAEKLAPSFPIDPGSPVAIPHPAVLSALIAPRGDVTLGALAIMDRPYLAAGSPVPVSLPWSVMVKHILVTGTTGSGKTSLVKNILYSVSRTQGGDVHIVVLDANQDYVAGLFPGYIPRVLVDAKRAGILRLYGVEAEPGEPVKGPSLRGLVVIPCPGDNCSPQSEAKRYAETLAGIARAMYSRAGGECRLVDGPVVHDTGAPYVYEAWYTVECGGEKTVSVYIAPRGIELRDPRQLSEIDPYMTERAREALPALVDSLGCRIPHPAKLAYCIERKIQEAKRYAPEATLQHLLRRLRVLANTGVINTAAPGIDYNELANAMESLGVNTLMLDLGYAATRSESDPTAVKVLLGYQLLRSLASTAEKGTGPGRILLVVDEAHLFFPRGGGEYAEMLRRTLERLARLGRSRGISLLLSTHRESDLSPLVVTLANTKIYMRTDRKTAEELQLPTEYRKRLPFYADYAAVLSSYAVHGGYLGLVSAPAAIGHRTA
ncbi:ATP-binding protein [Pyrodictium abyssi]|uniref:ATP-binding protein n=1 Tax=Pyrodictium abyssi TaxID=54256 RepID=A0ABM8J0J8_9CREN|nr:ATP-binding protein [Pyrodictium abyssi]